MGSDGGKKKLLLRKKVRRGWGGKNKGNNGEKSCFSILAANANGLKGKFDSLKRNINHFSSCCVIIQELKLRRNGAVKLKVYQSFDLIDKVWVEVS